MHDFRTLQDHIAPKTHSDLLFKGAVQNRARSVYTGLIRIRHDAKGSAAFQTNRNLTLSHGAWAESVPNLEIETNDVKCSHASTVGPIDDEQRFYLESRGIPPEVAERLVVLGFFDEVLDQLPVGPLATELRQQVSAKLQRRTS
jgi:Fe-S cluster assembly protein SufD